VLCKCDIHGYQTGIATSPDVEGVGANPPKLIAVTYMLEDTPLATVYLTPSFSDKHHIVPGVYHVDSELPVWDSVLIRHCGACFREHFPGHPEVNTDAPDWKTS
jgi:hypothetical protein